MVIATLAPLVVMALQNYFFAKKTIRHMEVDYLQVALKTRVLWLRTWVSHTRQEFYLTGFHSADHEKSNKGAQGELASVKHTLFELFRGHGKFRSITLYDTSWQPVIHVPETYVDPPPLPSKKLMTEVEKGGLFISGTPYYGTNGDAFIALGHTLTGSDFGSFIVAELNLTKSLRRILADTSDLQESGEVFLVSSDKKVLFHTRSGTKQNLQQAPVPDFDSDVFSEPHWTVQKVMGKKGNSLFSVTAPVPEVGWYLILQVDEKSSTGFSRRHALFSVLTFFCALVFVLLITAFISARFIRPLEKLSLQARQVSENNDQERLQHVDDPYIDGLVDSFNTIRDSLAECREQFVQSTALSTVGKLTSSLIHEMRSPLSSIRINLQALSRKVRGDQVYTEMTEISLAQVNRLETLFQDMLDFSKPINLDIKKTSFSQIVEESLRTFSGAISGELMGNMAPGAKNKNISFNVNDNLASKPLWLDREQVCRALINLISNAIEWSGEGTEVKITGSFIEEEKQIVFEVADSGPGLSREVENRIFEPFYTSRDGGTGLGLANVKKIVEYHGGTVIAKNIPDGGALFSMIFPDTDNDE